MVEQEIYLNHAGTSWPKPQVVSEAVATAMAGSASAWGERFEQAHRSIAEFFGISDPEQLLLTPGCTSSLAVGIGDMDLAGRSRVLTSVWEHHAMHRPLLKLQPNGAAQKSGSALASMGIYVLMGLVLIWRPTGLFGARA